MPRPSAQDTPRRAASRRAAPRAAAALGLAAVAAPLAWAAYSAWGAPHQVPIPSAVDAARRSFQSHRAGRLAYYAADDAPGRPLVLLHGINAAASSFEMHPLFSRARGERPVFALDLPGFGFSERSDREYTPELYAAAIEDFLRDELGCGGERPAADVVALSLTCEFAARVARDHPELVRALALISPTGFGRADAGVRDDGAETRLRLMAARPLSQPLYDLLASRRSIEYFLRKSFVGAPDDSLVEYAWRSAHQPGARFAPLAFVSGRLFTADVRTAIYDRVPHPVLVLHDQDPYAGFDELPATVLAHDSWRAQRIAPSRGLPQFEHPDETARALDVFWAVAEQPGFARTEAPAGD